MGLKAMKCPECGAPIRFEQKQDYVFCSHCGLQVFKDSNTININKSVTYRRIDEARLRELEFKERKFDAEEKHRKKKTKIIVISIVLIVLLLGAAFVYAIYGKSELAEVIGWLLLPLGAFGMLFLVAIFLKFCDWLGIGQK